MKREKSFTLIELLVVIVIIGLLASIVLVSLKGAIERAKVTKVRAEIEQVIIAMYVYREITGQLPPIGDNCSACTNPCNNTWVNTIDALVAYDLIQPGVKSQLEKDAWGNYYCYDDNDEVCCGGCSPVYSMGPNGVNDSWNNCPRNAGCPQSICMDDIGEILPFGDRPYPW